MTSPPPLDPYSPTPYAQQRAATAHRVETPPRAPALLPIALLGILLLAFPIATAWLLFDVLEVTEDLFSPILAITLVVSVMGPILGIAFGVRALRSCHGPPCAGGWILAIGCVLQLIMIATVMLATFMTIPTPVAVTILILGGLAVITNVVAGVLGLVRAN